MAGGLIPVLGATSAYSTEVFKDFPPMEKDVIHEDRVLPFRALLLGGCCIKIDEKLVRYRIEGGVSRLTIITGTDYIFRYIPSVCKRTLPDAFQRVLDVKSQGVENKLLVRATRKVVVSQISMLGISEKKWLGVEFALLKGVFDGGRAGYIFRFYMKRRFSFIFNLYIKFLRPI
jgi:hypothetical protein